MEHAALVLYLFDASAILQSNNGLNSLKIEIEKLKNQYPQKQLLVIANKIDTLSPKALTSITSTVENLLPLSAKTGEGVTVLKEQLLNLVNTGALRNNETIVTNSRHYDALLKALEEITKVQQGMDDGLPGDLLAIDIRQALYHFGEITGEITTDDLLGNIFANFCIGK